MYSTSNKSYSVLLKWAIFIKFGFANLFQVNNFLGFSQLSPSLIHAFSPCFLFWCFFKALWLITNESNIVVNLMQRSNPSRKTIYGWDNWKLLVWMSWCQNEQAVRICMSVRPGSFLYSMILFHLISRELIFIAIIILIFMFGMVQYLISQDSVRQYLASCLFCKCYRKKKKKISISDFLCLFFW